MQDGSFTDLEVFESDPAVGGKVLEHRNEELKATIPVSEQQNHGNEVEDAHEFTRSRRDELQRQPLL